LLFAESAALLPLRDARGFGRLLLEEADRDFPVCFPRPFDRDAALVALELADAVRLLFGFDWGILTPPSPWCYLSWLRAVPISSRSNRTS
jgi:hypothetical protein